jgi:hypothetical protein
MDPQTRRELRSVRRILLVAGLATGVSAIIAFRQI